MNDEVLVVVGYHGGYGGSFFANVLQKALSENSSKIIPISNKNEFIYDTDVMGDERYALDAIMKAYDKGIDEIFYLKFFEDNNYKNHWGEMVRKIYEDCYDTNRSVFNKNITNYFKKRLKLKSGFNVTNMHYSKPYEGFSIKDIYENTIYFSLEAESIKHHMMFDLILDLKHGNFKYPEFILKSLDTLSDFPEVKKQYDSCHLIEVGKLFFEIEKNNIEDVEKKLSSALNHKICLDKDMILDYSKSNLMVLDEFLSIDCEKSSFLELIRAAKKKLNSLL